MYLKTKIAEVHNISNDEGTSCYSDPNGLARNLQMKSKAGRSMYHPFDRRSLTNESKASVYYTPNDMVDQPQLQLSPMHINIIRENLDTFSDCSKPSESMCKFDFDIHRLKANLEQEIDRRRRHIGLEVDDDDDDDDDYDYDETIEINAEKTRMLNGDHTDRSNNSTQGYIRLNTLPKRNKHKRAASGNDFYYSLENVFDQATANNSLYQMHLSNKTIDEASCEETQLTSSASDNCSSNDMSRLNSTNVDNERNPSQSVLVLNEVISGGINEIITSKSMPNISKTDNLTKEQSSDDIEQAIVHKYSQLDQMLPN